MSETNDKLNSKPAAEATKAVPQCTNCGGCHSCKMSCQDGRCNLQCYNWLADVPGNDSEFDIVEVHFKNTRKGFYRNSAHLPLAIGDMVAVEASPGHDIGRVSLTGRLVKLQMKKARLRPDAEILRVFRKAKPSDLERYEEAKAREVDTMIRSRQIAKDLHLNMKIGDVEYQGDGNKAIFYYIADGRVDFRQLIKVLADVFKVRVEMKQIGARQEAGRIGGIGPCGRPLCCASWMTNFVSVSTGAARFQDISLNPQKLAGQCAKLKCCINFEVDDYVEASKKMPPRGVQLETASATYYHFKADLLKQEVSYSTEKNQPVNVVTVPVARAFEVMELNKQGVKPETLSGEAASAHKEQSAFGDLLGQDSINRFDKKKKKKNKGGKDKAKQQGQQQAKQQGQQPKQGQQQPKQGQQQPKQGQQAKQQQGEQAAAGGNNKPKQGQGGGNGNRRGRGNNRRGPKPGKGGNGNAQQQGNGQPQQQGSAKPQQQGNAQPKGSAQPKPQNNPPQARQ